MSRSSRPAGPTPNPTRDDLGTSRIAPTEPGQLQPLYVDARDEASCPPTVVATQATQEAEGCSPTSVRDTHTHPRRIPPVLTEVFYAAARKEM